MKHDHKDDESEMTEVSLQRVSTRPSDDAQFLVTIKANASYKKLLKAAKRVLDAEMKDK